MNPTSTSGESPNRFLMEKIWRKNCLLDALCDPSQFEAQAAVTVAQRMMEVYHNFDARLVSELMAVPDVAAGRDRRIERCLTILDAVSSGRRIIMPLMQLMNSENRRIRSKVAGILSRRMDNLAWIRKSLDEIDDRTRANIVEGLWGNDSPEIRELLWKALRDRNNRVRGNAILALYRLGAAGVLPAIRELLESQTATFRATAAWVMGATGDQRFRGGLKTLRQDAEASVRAAALRALVQLNKSQATDSVTFDPLIYFCEDLEGVRRVGFDLVEAEKPLRSLLPTEVVVTNHGNLVWEYDLVERPSCRLSALFLIGDGPEQRAPAGLGDAFAQCLKHKDPDDLWSLVRMAAGPPEGNVAELACVPAPYRGPNLQRAIERFDKLPRVQTQELTNTVRLVGLEGPGRHLILLLAPGALSDADLDLLTPVALGLNCMVDVITFSSSGTEPLQKLARQTHGVFMIAPESVVSPEWMVQAYDGIVHRYEVTCALTASPDSDVQIEVIPPRQNSSPSETG